GGRDRGHAGRGPPPARGLAEEPRRCVNLSGAGTLHAGEAAENSMDSIGEMGGIFHSEIGLGTIFARLCAAAFLGLLMGLDREYRQHPAGMRTHMLVSLASATFAVLTFEIIALTSGGGLAIRSDPVRAIGAVTAGVSFLAAGT